MHAMFLAIAARSMGIPTDTITTAPSSSQHSPQRASSPPPAIEDELDVFMEAFRVAKRISADLISDATDRLREERYTPDILSEATVTFERLRHLTKFAEGEVHQFRKFARDWTGKIEGKRARRGMKY
jgi:hypothetical protein